MQATSDRSISSVCTPTARWAARLLRRDSTLGSPMPTTYPVCRKPMSVPKISSAFSNTSSPTVAIAANELTP
jgi:hypothetical protein